MESNLMITLMLGYVLMGLIFLVFRFFCHILLKENPQKKLSLEVENDIRVLYAYAKQLIVSNPKKCKIIGMIMICLAILPMVPLHIEIKYVIEDFLSSIMFFISVIIFAPQKNPSDKGFPVEIFGFIYSTIFMYYSAGVFIFDLFYAIDSLNEGMWTYGYGITLIS